MRIYPRYLEKAEGTALGEAFAVDANNGLGLALEDGGGDLLDLLWFCYDHILLVRVENARGIEERSRRPDGRTHVCTVTY